MADQAFRKVCEHARATRAAAEDGRRVAEETCATARRIVAATIELHERIQAEHSSRARAYDRLSV